MLSTTLAFTALCVYCVCSIKLAKVKGCSVTKNNNQSTAYLTQDRELGGYLARAGELATPPETRSL